MHNAQTDQCYVFSPRCYHAVQCTSSEALCDAGPRRRAREPQGGPRPNEHESDFVEASLTAYKSIVNSITKHPVLPEAAPISSPPQALWHHRLRSPRQALWHHRLRSLWGLFAQIRSRHAGFALSYTAGLASVSMSFMVRPATCIHPKNFAGKTSRRSTT